MSRRPRRRPPTRQQRASGRVSGGSGVRSATVLLGLSAALLLMSPWGRQDLHWHAVTFAAAVGLAVLWAGSWGLRALAYQGDDLLWPIAASLLGLGMLVQARLGGFVPAQGLRPYIWAYLLSPAAFLGAVALRGRGLEYLRRYHVFAALGAAGLMYWLVLKQGVAFRGAVFGPGLTTPSELLKLLLAIYLAGYLARRLERGFEGILGASLVGEGVLFLALWCVPQAMFLIQRDLGVVVLFGILVITMFFVATGQPAYLVAGAAVTGLSAALLAGLFPHAAARWEIWLDPWRDPRGSGWQTLQGLLALHAGWLDGVGLGGGYPDVIPVVSSDFIYAALGEELGLWGCGTVLLLYSGLLWRGWRIADDAADEFGRLLAVGLTTLLAIQAFVNIAGVVRVMPITGLTLPFLSRGGSSLLVSVAAVGLLAAVSDRGRAHG